MSKHSKYAVFDIGSADREPVLLKLIDDDRGMWKIIDSNLHLKYVICKDGTKIDLSNAVFFSNNRSMSYLDADTDTEARLKFHLSRFLS